MTKANNHILEIKALTKSFHTKEGNVIDSVGLNIKTGSVVSLLGESGCGKTTFARLIAGLETPNSGEIILDGKIVANASKFVPPQRRKVGMVFQDYALFPHMNVLENVGYGILNHLQKERRIQEVLTLVGLQDLGYRYPHQLSGGQQQRVALARALAPKPQLLLLDEPFSNLDTRLKRSLRSELFQIVRKSEVTAIFLTHDTQDAMAVADHIVILRDGKVEQQGTAESLYQKPSSIYIAQLFEPIVVLRKKDLLNFNFPVKPNMTYAIRQGHFIVDSNNSTYHSEIKIEKSTFLGYQYSNLGQLPNGGRLYFNSNKKMSDLLVIGFEEDQLLKFEKSTS